MVLSSVFHIIQETLKFYVIEFKDIDRLCCCCFFSPLFLLNLFILYHRDIVPNSVLTLERIIYSLFLRVIF